MKNVTKGTIIRTVLLALALTNQVLVVLGVSPIPVDDNTVTNLISTICTVVTAIMAWWKNNSFTEAAIEADKMLKER